MKRFEDAPDTAVITTVYVVRQQSPILFVAHFEDGYWQFSGAEGEEEGLPDEDYLVLTLAEVVALDGTVVEVSDLPRGAAATRQQREATGASHSSLGHKPRFALWTVFLNYKPLHWPMPGA